MRADRLVATLLLLQARGRVTANEVAEELEVSPRTARRDLEALSMAGIPVYSQPGRGGGWSLIGGARTDLSGLTAAEARTLFLIAGPSSAVTPDAKAALRKLVQALPETFRAEAEKAASAVVLDPAQWGGTALPPPPHLGLLQQAVVQGVQVRLGYTDRERAVSERVVHPLGLVAKGSVWYLVAGTDAGLRTFRVWRVRSVELTGEPVQPPPGFDLAATWRDVVAKMDERRSASRVRALADPPIVGWLRGHFGTRLRIGDRGDDGRVAVEIGFGATENAARELAGYGPGLEVLDPPEVRQQLAAIGAGLVERYGAPRPSLCGSTAHGAVDPHKVKGSTASR
ncbi:MAG: WYL domain-containing protein [Actinobacteria bacterium]|nr:WYL domain-containing protein [Actinomycetota bacterium]